MNLSLTNKTSFFILFLITILLVPLTASSATEEATDWLDKPINLSFQNKPLSNVLKQISQQTGISIAYDQKLANEKVSGTYQDVKASDAINRLFRDKNKSIQVNKTKKIIIVKTFGAKNFIWAATVQNQNIPSQITLKGLEKMHTLQYKEFKEQIANDNEFLTDEGLTRGELRDMQEQQYALHHKRITNDSELLKDEDMTRAQLRNMQEQQYENHNLSLTNDNKMLDDEGMTRGQLQNMQEQQYENYKVSFINNNEILEDEGITLIELRTMQKQQYKEYRSKQNNPQRTVGSTIY